MTKYLLELLKGEYGHNILELSKDFLKVRMHVP